MKPYLKLAPLMIVLAIGCDQRETEDAAKSAGDNVEKAVKVTGEAANTAAKNIGEAMERTGEKLRSAAEPSTQPTTAPTSP